MIVHTKVLRRALSTGGAARSAFAITTLLAFSLTVTAQTSKAPVHACSATETTFDGWKAMQIANQWVAVTIVPQLGGRVMQVEFAGHPYLFINPQYKGKYTPPPEDPKGKWFNYGGDKIWPMPEGNQDEHHWPGPIADALDDGEYGARILSEGRECRVRLDGPADKQTGLQYSREIALDVGSPEISFHAVMKNSTAHPIEWSMQSVTQYDLADAQNSATFNRNFWAYTPANSASAYLEGFHVRSGLADDPSFTVQGGLFTLHWLYLQNEVWIDSPGDWLAVVDRSSGFAMVERFTVHPEAGYPGKATVIFYKNGPAVEMDEHGMPMVRINPDDAPFYMEAEINSPIVTLDPDETYAMDTQWFPTRTADNFQTVNPTGLVSQALMATAKGGRVQLEATVGVFFLGKVEARFLDSAGNVLSTVEVGPVRPDQLLTLDRNLDAPAATARVQLRLVDESGIDRGLLAEAEIKRDSGEK